jgi:probable HAF family extracellular repeat protein
MLAALLLASSVLYNIVAIGDEPGFANAINQKGVVAGRLGDGAFTLDGNTLVRYDPEQFMYLDGPYTSVANALNNAGIAVGSDGSYMPVVMSGLELATAVVFERGRMTYLNKSYNGTFEAQGINDRGEIVGAWSYRGFVRPPSGQMIEIQPLSTRPEWNGTRASAIDNEGDIVGGTTIDVPWKLDVNAETGPRSVSALPIHAFWLRVDSAGRQHMTDLGALPNFPNTYATAIAEDQTIVGYSGWESGAKWTRISGPSHAWVWQHGRMSDLGVLRYGESSVALGVNDVGEIVGCSGEFQRTWQGTPYIEQPTSAVIWRNKHIVDLNTEIDPRSGWHLSCARAINRKGWIAGNGLYRGAYRAFVLIPD